MSDQAPRRRLAAILAADVVGYSRMMQADEAGTLAALKARRTNILQPLVTKHHGRVVKLMGDGVLVEFASAVSAVQCATELEEAMEGANRAIPPDQHIVLRVGINLGDIIVEGSDLYGDGVNVAARLESIAEPGNIYLSQTVVSHVRGKIPSAFEDLGERSLKNMAEPVRVYKVSRAYADISADAPKQSAVLSKPSVAVLPFANVSGDLEQEYFSDGITEDIIIDLSRVSRLNVLSRHTVFALKGRAVDVREIAQQLNVTHVVEGSVRKAGGRVRITAQLIEATKDVHIWAERYDHELNDIFAVQDEISQAIVTALKISLLPVEKTAIESRSTKNSEAYDLYLRARHYQVMFGVRNLEIALRFSQRALEVDPNYARAWALIAVCRAALHLRGRSEETGLSDAERALSLDPALAEAYAAKGRALAGLGRFDEALAAHEESLRLEPDSFEVRLNFGRTCLYLGRHEAAILHLERGAQLRETDYHCLSILASAYRAWGRLDECQYAARRALERLELEISLRPDNANALVNGVIALAYLGENQRAKEWASRALTIDPDDALDHYNLACAMVQINELDQALSLLESCSPRMPAVRVKWMMRDADLKPLHSLPRFQALIAAGEARLAALLDERAPGTA